MITLGGDAELELVDSLDPFSEGTAAATAATDTPPICTYQYTPINMLPFICTHRCVTMNVYHSMCTTHAP